MPSCPPPVLEDSAVTEQTPAPTRRHVLKVAGALAGSAAIAGIKAQDLA
ncbi:MAG: twin-arginine translocation signal domain-containing protein [Propionibacteriaceae bacterium]|nr:MAG: twin-arginine translocation signal domain-containing protein [Propionibacteriaceae bacterium]